MANLVKYYKGDVLTNSYLVADKFGKQHNYVVKKIDTLLKDCNKYKVKERLELNFVKTEKIYRGQSFKMYLMDKEAFSLLCMQFSGKKAREWQYKFNKAFYDMERALLKEQSNKDNLLWKEQREQGKIARIQETDVIKMFVDYAMKQGSQNAKFYYKHITTATYKALELVQSKKPRLRDTLDTLQLSQLIVAESIASKGLIKYMQDGEHYKSIFTLVKRDLETYASSLYLGFNIKDAIK